MCRREIKLRLRKSHPQHKIIMDHLESLPIDGGGKTTGVSAFFCQAAVELLNRRNGDREVEPERILVTVRQDDRLRPGQWWKRLLSAKWSR